MTFVCGHTVARAELNNVRWVSHCRDLVQLPEGLTTEFETDTIICLRQSVIGYRLMADS